LDLFRLHNLTRRFGRVLALDCREAALPPGAVGLLGPNGAGKSTLIKVLLGLLDPTRGRAELLGLDPTRRGRAIRARVGYMSEGEMFAPGLRALEQVALAGELCGMPRRQALRRAHEVIQYLDVGEARYRPVEDLPTGLRQRIKLAQALVHDPQLLILDEPTNGLDPGGRRALLELIRSLHGRFGKSIILSSHLLEDVERVCDSLLILQDGAMLACGPKDDLRLQVRDRYRVHLRGDVNPLFAALAAQGVTAVEPPRRTNEGWEAVLEGPQGWSTARIFELLDGSRDQGAVLRSLVPEREKLGDLFRRLTAQTGSQTAGPREVARGH